MGLDDNFTGKGIGSALLAALLEAADNWYALRRVQLEAYVDNEPALRLYKKFGFEIEGKHIKAGFCNGKFVDVYSLARLRF